MRCLLTTSLLEVNRFWRGVKLYVVNGNDDGANRVTYRKHKGLARQ